MKYSRWTGKSPIQEYWTGSRQKETSFEPPPVPVNALSDGTADSLITPTSSSIQSNNLAGKLSDLRNLLAQQNERRRARNDASRVERDRSEASSSSSSNYLVSTGLSENTRGATPLPPGWNVANSPDGRTYYYNRSLGKTQWNPPLISTIPAPRPMPSPPLISTIPSPRPMSVAQSSVTARRPAVMPLETARALNTKPSAVDPLVTGRAISSWIMKSKRKSTFSKAMQKSVAQRSERSTDKVLGRWIADKGHTYAAGKVDVDRLLRDGKSMAKKAAVVRSTIVAEAASKSAANRNQKTIAPSGFDMAKKRWEDARRDKRIKSLVTAPANGKDEDNAYDSLPVEKLELLYKKQLAAEKKLLRQTMMAQRKVRAGNFASPKNRSETPELWRAKACEARRIRVSIMAALDRKRDSSSPEKESKTFQTVESKKNGKRAEDVVEEEEGEEDDEDMFQLPKGWSATVDSASGRPYYYNVESGESSWTPPGMRGHLEQKDLQLPAGWARATTMYGRKYYYNSSTGERKWDYPVEEIAEAENEIVNEDDPKRPQKHKFHFIPSAESLVQSRRSMNSKRYSRARYQHDMGALVPGSTRRNLQKFLRKELNDPTLPLMREARWRNVILDAQNMADVQSELKLVDEDIRELKRDMRNMQLEMEEMSNTQSVPAFARMQERLKERNRKRLEKSGTPSTKMTDAGENDDGSATNLPFNLSSDGDPDFASSFSSPVGEEEGGVGSAAEVTGPTIPRTLESAAEVKAQRSIVSSAVLDAFESLDPENSGNVTAESVLEYAQACHLVEGRADKIFFDTLLQAVDLNGDGMFQIIEFAAIVDELKDLKRSNRPVKREVDVQEEREIALSHSERLNAVNEVMKQVLDFTAEEKVSAVPPRTRSVSESETLSSVLGLATQNTSEVLRTLKESNAELARKVEDMFAKLDSSDQARGSLVEHAPPGM